MNQSISPYVYPGLDKPEINQHEVNLIVSKHFEVPFDSLYLKSRKREIVDARKAAMYIMRKYTTESFKTIGGEYNLHHATCLYACNKSVPSLIEYDWEYRMKIEKVQGDIERRFSLGGFKNKTVL